MKKKQNWHRENGSEDRTCSSFFWHSCYLPLEKDTFVQVLYHLLGKTSIIIAFLLLGTWAILQKERPCSLYLTCLGFWYIFQLLGGIFLNKEKEREQRKRDAGSSNIKDLISYFSSGFNLRKYRYSGLVSALDFAD